MHTAAPDQPPTEPSSDSSLRADLTRPESTATPRRSRRAFVFFGALAAASMVPRRLRSQRPTRKRAVVEDPNEASPFKTFAAKEVLPAPSEWVSSTGRLVRRATLGITRDEVAQATSMGYQGYLLHQLNYQRIDDSAVDAFVASTYPYLSYTGEQLYALDAGTLARQLQESTIYRAAFSRRQLYERMVEFWSDHFNIDYDKVQYLKVLDDRDVIRKYALGKFPDLLKASAHSAAMLAYLDQTTSRNGAPNQNYAREIMELHTLGVDGGYTQTDVSELARVLTGWTIQGRGNFFFNPAIHDWGAKTVLGGTIPAGSPALGQEGIKEGETMLDLLVKHPSTARFIATKMLKWLLTPTPSEAQITTVASVYRATGGDIKAMVRAILNDEWLPASPLKLKRPFHYLVSALRSAAPTVTSLTAVNGQLATLGQALFTYDTPDGFPDKAEYWAGNILPRWNFGVYLSTQAGAALAVDTTAYRAGSVDNAIDLIDQNFFGGELDATMRLALLNYLKGGTFNDTRVRETISLALSSNGFQWY